MKGFTHQAIVALVLISVSLFHLTHSAPTISNSLRQILDTPNGQANILLSMTSGSPSEALKSLKLKSFSTRGQRLNAVASVLRAEASRAQKNVLNFLQAQKSSSHHHKVTQLWVSNQIIVRNADSDLIRQLLEMPEISKIDQEVWIPIEEVYPSEKTLKSRGQLGTHADEQWGVVTIEAPAVWANGTSGEGVVVGTIDTGVRGTHEALNGSYRGGDYSFYAPYENTQDPSDGATHGTHTMGTILGSANGIGVAPSAKWMACKWCASSRPECSDFSLLECGQYILCPTKYDGSDPDCTQAPHIVSNSWAWGSRPWYDDILNGWTAAGIIPVFAVGNDGTYCETTLYPGDMASVISVGATTSQNYLSDFSSVGPNQDGLRRPDVAAPGSSVYSSTSGSDSEYGSMSGTSMACPHVAGTAALLLSRKPDMGFEEIRSLLESGAVPINSRGNTCGGLSDEVYPNNHVGHGRIDALNSFANLVAQIGA